MTLDDDMSEMLTTLYNTLDGARTQLEGRALCPLYPDAGSSH